MIGDYLDQYTYTYLMETALARVPDTIDKREGSIIYDALAPACYKLAEFYMELKQILLHSYAITASGEYLTLRAAEQGLIRYSATYAIKKGVFTRTGGEPASIPLGSRFSTISDTESINYYVSEPYTDEEGIVVPGSYKLVCETLGTVGNAYVGSLLPITYIQGLETATMENILVPARDEETDEELRTRYFLAVNEKPFGGNVAQYDEAIKEISGVGEVQVYPTWNGGGTVKCSVIDAEYNVLTQEFIDLIQDTIDPGSSGAGLGIAPIGHTVSIVTPNVIEINIITTITLRSGYTIPQLQPLIEEAISNYLLDLRKNWGIADELNQYYLSVYIAQINSVILSVQGVANVENTTINGLAQDLDLTETGITQELPIMGTVTLNG